MRIIGGRYRSRRILAPADAETTRPITDRVKQALFDRLWDAGLLEEGNAVDLFAGTGSLGLEALSRGIEHCTFVERDGEARRRLEQNLANLGLTDRSMILKVDALSTGWIRTLPRLPLRVVFCDPPFSLTEDERSGGHVRQVLAALAAHLEPGGAAVLRTSRAVDAGPIEGYMPPARHVYGSMALHSYQTALPEEEA